MYDLLFAPDIKELTDFKPMFHLWKKVGGWFLLTKYMRKHLWKSDILSKDAGR